MARPEDPRLTELRSLGATIGEDVYVGPDVYIERDFAPLLRIDDQVVLSQGVVILLHDSSLNNLVGAPIRFGEVHLGRRSYLGANSLIMCGVSIGEGALVGAASMVNADVAPGTVVYGQPARPAGTVEEVLARQRTEAKERRSFFVEAQPWRLRTPDDDERLDQDIRRAMQDHRSRT